MSSTKLESVYEMLSTKDVMARLRDACGSDTWAGLARNMGVSGSNVITNWIRRDSFDLDLIYNFAIERGFNLHWVLSGNGPRTGAEIEQQIPLSLIREYPLIGGFILACQLKEIELMKALSLRMAGSFESGGVSDVKIPPPPNLRDK